MCNDCGKLANCSSNNLDKTEEYRCIECYREHIKKYGVKI